jgi:hypothetical protein
MAAMNIASWNARLDAASTQWALVLTARAYLADLPEGDIGSLREECRMHQLNDGEDVAHISRKLHSLAFSRSVRDEAEAAPMAGFFGHASRRLAALASNAAIQEAIAFDQASDTRYADSIGRFSRL